MNYHDSRQVLTRLSACIVLLDAYAEVNKGEDCAGDMQYASDSLRVCMYLLAGKEESERFIAVMREELEAKTAESLPKEVQQ